MFTCLVYIPNHKNNAKKTENYRSGKLPVLSIVIIQPIRNFFAYLCAMTTDRDDRAARLLRAYEKKQADFTSGLIKIVSSV